MQYSDMFKNAMIQKLSGPDAISASALSKQVDVSQSTLSKWLRMQQAYDLWYTENKIRSDLSKIETVTLKTLST